jgi:hypothetical protein
MLRQQRLACVPPATTQTEVEHRRLADYDSALGVADGGMAW